MRLVDFIYLSGQSFKNRKSRLILTVLGVSVAIGAILFLVSLGFGLQKVLLEKITTKESLLTLDVATSDVNLVPLNNEAVSKISAVSGVKKVSVQATFSGQISLGELTSETALNLVDQDFFALAGLETSQGKNFVDSDTQKVVVNTGLAELFNVMANDILGEKIKISVFTPKEGELGAMEVEVFEVKSDFEIIGVVDDSGAPAIFLKRDDLKDLVINEFQTIKVRVESDEVLEEIREKIIGLGFIVSALSDTIAEANKIFNVVQITLGIFGIVALIVAAIGLVNTMTISMLERTASIGIMRAIGATPGDIKKIFLIEAFMIGFAGGVGGIIFGILSSQLFNVGINFLASALGSQKISLFDYPVWFILFIVILSSFVGLIGGFWPARRASRLNPLKALRYK